MIEYVINLVTILLYSSLFYSCNHETKMMSLNNRDCNIIASVNGVEVDFDDIDSMGRIEIYNIRKQKIKQYITETLLSIEASKIGLTKDAYVDALILNQGEIIENANILQFINLNPGFVKKEEEVKKILFNIRKNEIIVNLVDSLSLLYKVKTYLLPEYSKVIDTTDIKGISLNNCGNHDRVFLIINFDCPGCIKLLLNISEIMKKYDEAINFELIYLDSSLEIPAKAISLADRTKIARSLIQHMINRPDSIHYQVFYTDFFSNYGLDYKIIEDNFENDKYLIKMLKVRDKLFKQEVYTTPSLVINEKLYDGCLTQDELDLLMSSLIRAKIKI